MDANFWNHNSVRSLVVLKFLPKLLVRPKNFRLRYVQLVLPSLSLKRNFKRFAERFQFETEDISNQRSCAVEKTSKS
jgi:hypothetical protein